MWPLRTETLSCKRYIIKNTKILLAAGETIQPIDATSRFEMAKKLNATRDAIHLHTVQRNLQRKSNISQQHKQTKRKFTLALNK